MRDRKLMLQSDGALMVIGAVRITQNLGQDEIWGIELLN